MMFTGKKGMTCTIHGPDIKITPEMTCGLYVEGENHTDMIGKEMAMVTPEESGLEEREVRCENCAHFSPPGTCKFFEKEEIDSKVIPTGCCNANEPIEKLEKLNRALR